MSQTLDHFHARLSKANTIRVYGKVSRVVGLAVEGICPGVSIGASCLIETATEGFVAAEVVGFRENSALLMPFGETRGIAMGNRIRIREAQSTVAVGSALLGRVIDGMGQPIDNRGPISATDNLPIYNVPPNALYRKRITEPLDLGVRTINSVLTVGRGQRIGIMAGSGVGKSTLMGMIARYTTADVNVIALIGERGRELRDFIESELGPEGLKRSVVVVATSDQPPVVKARAASVATTIAEYFRRTGKNVLLMMDSLTRWAMAQREIGLAVGEPPTARGYTPSVFALMPKLLERVGTSDSDGSITGIYTVLVEGDDVTEPVTDAARSILDGHIVLSRKIASTNRFPAIDVGGSISRVMEDVTSPEHRAYAGQLRRLMAAYEEAADLINLGIYQPGRDKTLDDAVRRIDAIRAFLTQARGDRSTFNQSLELLRKVVS